MRLLWAGALALALGGCAASSGAPADGFLNAQIADAYLPLSKSMMLVLSGEGAAVAIGSGIAVTNAHNFNLLADDVVIGRSRDYDLLFFRTDRQSSLASAAPRVGERVVAYGQGTDNDLRIAHGVVNALDVPVPPLCPTCAVQSAFTFEGDAGKGFSGGPLVDAQSGRLLGIVFGYVDNGPRRTMYAYGMQRVEEELAGVERRNALNAGNF